MPFTPSALPGTLVNFTRLVRDRTRGRDGALVLGHSVWVLAFVVAVAVGGGGIEHRDVVADLAFIPPTMVTVVLAWWTARSLPARSMTSWAWRALALSCVVLCVADALKGYYESPGSFEFPNWSDAGYLSFYPTMFASLLLFSLTLRRGTDRLKFWMDAAMMLPIGMAALWYFLLGPILASTQPDLLTTLAVFAYPIGDFILLLGLTALSAGRAGDKDLSSVRTLAVAILVYICADIAYGALVLQGAYQGGDPTDILWMVSGLLITVAAQMRLRAGRATSEQPPRPAVRPRASVPLLPYTAAALGGGLLLFTDRADWSEPQFVIDIAVIISTAIVVSRQIIVLRENAVLYTAARTEIAERVRAEEVLDQLRRKHELILQSAGEGIFGLDEGGRITFVNETAAEFLGSSTDSLIGSDLHAAGYHALADGSPCQSGSCPLLTGFRVGRSGRNKVEDVFRRQDGTSFPVERVSTAIWEKAQLVGAVVTFSDISQRRQAEVELRQTQKLESVGRLAAGIAHEINTPVHFVGDNLHFLKRAMNSDDPTMAEEVSLAIDESLDGVQRIASIVRALGEFAHPDDREQVLADLNQSLLSTLTVARSELRSVGEIVTDLGTLPSVRCHPGDLSQVFLNLLVNAAHAVADADRADQGVVKVSSWRDGGHAVIRIEDNGCGIPVAIRAHVFDPFFTTKEVGRGTGQGLALARSIVVDKHGGSLDFTSIEGEGTTFVVRLPIDGNNGENTRMAA
jgi:PAS domain S-box-containing protein